jgi:hypothetical protein
MQKIRKKGKLVNQFSVREYAAIVSQTPQNIRLKAKNNAFKTEVTGVSAIRNGFEYIIEVQIEKNKSYLEQAIKNKS